VEPFSLDQRFLLQKHPSGGYDMRSIALWLLGVPIPIIILLWFFMR
jgi:hypothetical protein